MAQILAAPSATAPGIGASGAIAGVLGAYLLPYPDAPVRVLVSGLFLVRVGWVPVLIVLGMWFVTEMFNGVLSLRTEAMATGGVAWFAHIGGFLVELVVAIMVRSRQRPSNP